VVRAVKGWRELSHRRGVDRLLDRVAGRVAVVHGLRGDSHMLAIIPPGV
jgi:hypothetical protein